MNYYISDLHFGHGNVIGFDNRPFKNVEEMDKSLIHNWNQVVSKKDTVYILGDFCWKKTSEWAQYLMRLKGNKVLIKGNHDLKQFPYHLKQYFQDIKEYKEISDNGRRVIMCHYPIPFYRSDYNENVYHLYGHLHNTIEEKYMQEIKKYIVETDTRQQSRNRCQFFNCWCGFYDWKPVTLDEIIKKWRI